METNQMNSPHSIFKYLFYFKARFDYHLCYTTNIYKPNTSLLHGVGEH